MSIDFRLDRILLDTNLLVLFIIGSTSVDIVARKQSQRCSAYEVKDYHFLAGLIGPPREVITIPHILAETRSLLKNESIYGAYREKMMRLFFEAGRALEEYYLASRLACATSESTYLGVTDAAIMLAATDASCTILTVDADLHNAAERRGAKSLNYWHLRDRYL